MIRLLSLVLLLGAPFVAGAQQNSSFCPSGTPENISELFNLVTCILTRSAIPLLFALALVLFIYGVVRYVIGAKEGKKGVEREEGRKFMIWGIIALAVMVTVWGLVNLLAGTFGLQGGAIPQLRIDDPSVQSPSAGPPCPTC